MNFALITIGLAIAIPCMLVVIIVPRAPRLVVAAMYLGAAIAVVGILS